MTSILLIKTSSLGDVIHSLPALTDAAAAIPDVRFDWVVEESFREVPAWHPAVDRVIPVALRRWRKHPLQARRSGEWSEFKSRIAERSYDAVIDAQGLLKSAWLTRYAKGPRFGLDRQSARESLAALFYHQPIAVPRGQHAVERVRQLFSAALGYAMPTNLGDYGLDRQALAGPSSGQPQVLFFHGTTWSSKHWPELYWRKLAEKLVEREIGVQLPWGNAEEKARAERLAEGLPRVQVLPSLSLAGMARVVAGAKACVAVDTGLGHLAAALNVPCLSLFGPTDAGLTGAYGPSQVHLVSDFPCAPCLQKTCQYLPTDEEARQFDLQREQPLCFTRVAPDNVFERLQKLLADHGAI
ncbi:lipopolysaccharide heptosyltransferase I [Porticoccus hydrocarbonoclasticus]|uniref:lipopolysaccharide heptosyltransferase I n=1 Tax=Porticoccus hydrocarbonoclasticus TaxID=1073414 RepID=UPI00055D0A7F|nr:lipopolysaccharide heptosyltransferase I [Porticoccus hydrocarbonoclasticus]